MDDNLAMHSQKSFEELKKINQHGAEYWSALSFCVRAQNDRFARAQTDNWLHYHFAGAGKVIILGRGI